MFINFYTFSILKNHVNDNSAPNHPNNWLSNILPPATNAGNRIDSVENSSHNTPLHNSLMSPVKPVNLLPDLPAHQSSRRLTDKEQKDCDVIGTFLTI